MSRTGRVVLGAGLVALAYAGHRVALRSGVRPADVAAVLPGDDLLPDAEFVVDRAARLPAPPAVVWPWILQLGKGRGGWYLPRLAEVVIPAGRRGARTVDASWTGLSVDDEVPDWGPGDAVLRVVAVEPERALVYTSTRPRRDASLPPMVMTWALVLTPVGDDETRLHLRLRIDRVGRRAPALVRELGGLMDYLTVAPLFLGLSERVRP